MIWNPSEGIDLGFFVIRFYSLMFVIAFGLGWYIMKYIFIKEKISLNKLDTLFIWTVLATLIGARLGHVFFYDWEFYRNHISQIFLPFRFNPSFEFTGYQGLASHGAAISIIGVVYLFSTRVIKQPVLWMLDRIVIPVASGAVFVRFGNFFNSEIVGKITEHKFGVRFIRDTYSANYAMAITEINDVNMAYDALINNPKFVDFISKVPAKHPAQLYEAGLYIFVFLILFILYWKTNITEKHGLLFGIFLFLLWTIRFLVEFVKESQGGFEHTLGIFTTGQWLSVPFIAMGLYFIIMAEKPYRMQL